MEALRRTMQQLKDDTNRETGSVYWQQNGPTGAIPVDGSFIRHQNQRRWLAIQRQLPPAGAG